MAFAKDFSSLPRWEKVLGAALEDAGIELNSSRDVFSAGRAPTSIASLDRPEGSAAIGLTFRPGNAESPVQAAEAALHELAHYMQLKEVGKHTADLSEIDRCLDDEDNESECYWISLAWVKEHAPELAAEYAKCVLGFLDDVSDDGDLFKAYSKVHLSGSHS
jgi:hypothetical protein